MFPTDGDDGPLKLNPDEIRAVEEGLRDGIGFFYQVASDIGENRHRVVEDGVRRGEERLGPHKAEVSLEVDTYDTARLAYRARKGLERGEELTDAQVRAALERNTIEPDRLAAYVRGDSPEGRPDGARDDEREEHGDDTEGE